MARLWLLPLILLAAANLPARQTATPADLPQEKIVGYQIGKQGANYRNWMKIVQTTDAQGYTTAKTNLAYVELAGGLNYKDPATGKWLPSREEIDAYPGGAIAQFGQHKVIFGNNLNAAGTIDLQMPDGREMKSDVLGLAYFDPASGKSVLIAQIQNSRGRIVGSNEVVYPDAFKGVNASVLYKYTLAGLEQDIVLQTQLPSPAKFGLSGSTVLQVLTEFTQAPTPTIKAAAASPLTDETLDFGSMQMIPGRAFLLGANSIDAGFQSARRTTSVFKHWATIAGRKVLIESVPLSAIMNQLKGLPSFSLNCPPPTNNSPLYAVSSKRLLPAPRLAKGDAGEMQLAKADIRQKTGFVLDYYTINQNYSSFTFQGDTTYFVNGMFRIGTATFEGGTVIKYGHGQRILYVPNGAICRTTPYHPAVFTSMDDDSVGEHIVNGSGNPSYQLDGSWDLWLPGANGDLSLSNMCFKYCDEGLRLDSFHSVTINDCQMFKCRSGIVSDNTPITFNNCLIIGDNSEGNYVITDNSSAIMTYTFNNCTIADGIVGLVSFGSSCDFLPYIYAANSIFANVSSWFYDDPCGYNFDSLSGTDNGFYNNDDNDSPAFGDNAFTISANPFQTVGGGHYYLATHPDGSDASGFRNRGTTAIDPGLLADLETKTTYPPVLYSNTTVSSDNFNSQVQRDTDGLDLGYHYRVLDYVFHNCTVSSDMTFLPGTAIGWWGEGLSISGDYAIYLDGRAGNPCYFVRCNTVQESDQGGDGIGIAGSGQSSNPIYATFTRFSALGDIAAFFDANSVYNGYLDDYSCDNCEFLAGSLGGASGAGLQLSCRNCLFDRSTANVFADSGGYGDLSLQNCTLRDGSLTVNNLNNNTSIEAYDSAFDGTSITLENNPGVSAANNAYPSGVSPLPNDANDVFVSGGFNWQSGPLGNFYLPPDSPLINTGDQAANQVSANVEVNGGVHMLAAPLSIFTTQTNQISRQVDTNMVDIGYHYPLPFAGSDLLISGNDPYWYNDGASIDTYDTLNVSPINSFLPQSESVEARGLAIYNGHFYYTEADYGSTGDIYICPYGTDGSGPNPVQDSGSLANTWRPGVGTQDLTFRSGMLYALTGYPLDSTFNTLQVFELNRVTGAVVAGPVNINPPVQDPNGATGTADGLTVLPDGNFLINDYDASDGCTTYREYYGFNPPAGKTPGALVQGGLTIDLSKYGLAGAEGVELSPDGQSLYFAADVDKGQSSYLAALVQTDLSGNLIGIQAVVGSDEDIDIAAP